jgi:site-specific DNA recombinase
MMKKNKPSPTAPSTPRIRCAIYTRKSTEEGLEQEYNSLDAQRDAGEAYIRSQHHEGWVCLPDRYDDGGFTGANMDRPGLRRLLEDIDNGRVDCVVVYKVDRLSRSLLDFARIMEAFEKRNIAFVSVTQAFNTGSSMGRLILNVLLSFAQFEREMISERTRDKIAAARRKGKWAGGRPVLGYNVVDTKLVVDPVEAVRVREIFQLYIEQQSLLKVATELNRRGWCTKQWITGNGRVFGGYAFTKTSLHYVIRNVVYVGKLRYKTEIHKGEHEGIVPQDVFDKAQAILAKNLVGGSYRHRNKHNALLRDKLRCAACDAKMGHSFSTSGNRLYRYYVCRRAVKHGWKECPSPSIPAGDVERFVASQLKAIVEDPVVVRDTLAQVRSKLDETIQRLNGERVALERQMRVEFADQGRLALAGGQRLAESHDRIRLAEARLAEIGKETVALKAIATKDSEMIKLLREFDGVWDALKPWEQARLIELLVDQVSYDGHLGKLSITYRVSGIGPLEKNSINHLETEHAHD